MKYELDVLAALTQLPQPTTQEIVAATGISERKVQNVIKSLQLELHVGIESIRKGRVICYAVKDWGVFAPGLLKETLASRPLKYDNKMGVAANKVAFYELVKMNNYKESARLEGISIRTGSGASGNKKSAAVAKRSLINKYSKYKMSNIHG